MKPHTHTDLLGAPECLRSSCGYKRNGILNISQLRDLGPEIQPKVVVSASRDLALLLAITPWARAKGTPLFLGSPGTLPWAESTTISHSPPKTQHPGDEWLRDQSFREACLAMSLEGTSSPCCASHKEGRTCHLCVVHTGILVVGFTRALGRKQRPNQRRDRAPGTGVVRQRQDVHWKPQRMK